MRQYVVPNKKIVCKILGVNGGQLQLSLRRVNSKEKKEVLEKYKQEKAVDAAITQIFGDKADDIKSKILNDYPSVSDFINQARREDGLIEKYIPVDKVDAIKKIVEKRKKNHEIRYLIRLNTLENDGIKRIKKILSFDDDSVSAGYISAGNYRIKLTVEDFKEGKKRISDLLEKLEKKAKENHCEFFATEEK